MIINLAPSRLWCYQMLRIDIELISYQRERPRAFPKILIRFIASNVTQPTIRSGCSRSIITRTLHSFSILPRANADSGRISQLVEMTALQKFSWVLVYVQHRFTLQASAMLLPSSCGSASFLQHGSEGTLFGTMSAAWYQIVVIKCDNIVLVGSIRRRAVCKRSANKELFLGDSSRVEDGCRLDIASESCRSGRHAM